MSLDNPSIVRNCSLFGLFGFVLFGLLAIAREV